MRCFRYLRSGWLTGLLAAALLLSACQGAATPATPATPGSPETTSQSVARVSATPEPATATATPEWTPTNTPVPTELPTETPTITPTPSVTPTITPTPAPKTIRETDNFLVLGVDRRPGEYAWRTDTIMIVAIDYDAGQIGVVSIPRDLWVQIPGYGMGRINQVDFEGEQQKYPGGGPALVAKVIADNFQVLIPPKHWVRLELEALPQLVDALGGVTVTLDCPLHELTPDPKAPDSGAYEHFDLPAGEVFLDGEDAAKFARYRYASNDFARAQRQQQLIWAIRERALQVDAIPKIPELWRVLSKTFKTDLGVLDAVRLARLGARLNADQVHGMTFSPKAIAPATVGGGAQVVKIIDPTEVQQELEGLFNSQPLALQGRQGSGCSSVPAPSLPTPLPSEATVEPEATPQEPPTAGEEPSPTPAP